MGKYLFIFYKHKIALSVIAFLGVLSSVAFIVTTYFSGMFIDIIIEATEFTDVLWICFILLGLSIIRLFLEFLGTYITGPVKEGIIYDFKSSILKHIKKTSIIGNKNYNTAYLSKRISDDSRQVASFFVDNYATVIIKIIEMVIVCFLVMTINIYIGVLMIFLCPIYFFVYKVFRKPIFEKSLSVREKSDEFFQDYSSQIEHMEDLLIEAEFSRDEKFLNNSFSSFRQKYKEYVSVNAKLSFVQGSVIALMQIIIFFIGGISVLQGATSIGLLSILMSYFGQILGNISYFVELARRYQVNNSAVHRIDEFMSAVEVSEGKHKLDYISSIDADVSYDFDDKNLFKNIQVKAKNGQVVGIKGANGAGKSTLLKVIVGIIKPKDGETAILFNNSHNIHDLDSEYLRNKALAYVPQKIRFKDLTLKEVFSEVESFENPEELITLLKRKDVPINADITNIIIDNWNEKINDLSGGGKQIVMILRSLIKNSSIFILDEPTSNLDVSRVLWFKDLINNIKKNKIIFIVSHENDVDFYDSIVTVK